MKKIIIPLATLVVVVGACGEKKAEQGKYPANFKTIGDEARAAFIMKNATPDSVARYLVYGALGMNPDTPVDSVASVTNYVYSHLRDEDAAKFYDEYEAVVKHLPLDKQMKMMALAGTEDPQKLGYTLGLEYMMSIREANKTVEDVERELQTFKKACGEDTVTYRRFMIGFTTVLKADHGVDVPEAIYKKYVVEGAD